jgi:hypothetical protein
MLAMSLAMLTIHTLIGTRLRNYYAMSESRFQSKVKNWLKEQGCEVLIITVVPGIPTAFPDIVGLAKTGRWVTLECKDNEKSPFRPLQKETIERQNRKGYSRAVYPENWDKIKLELEEII